MQLEFNLDDLTPLEIKFIYIEKALSSLQISHDKLRKSLYAKIDELKKTCSQLRTENHDLRHLLNSIDSNFEQHSKIEFVYFEGDSLCNIK